MGMTGIGTRPRVAGGSFRVARIAALAALVAGVAPVPARADFAAAVDLSAANQDANYPHIGMDNAGNAVIVWYRLDGVYWRIQTRALSAAGVLGPVQTLSSTGQHSILPRVAVDPAGNAVIVWQRNDNDGYPRIQLRVRPASGAIDLSPVQTLSEPGDGATHARVAVDNGGNAVVVWYRAIGPHYRVQLRTRAAGGGPGLGPVETLSLAGQHSATPEVAVDAEGNAGIVWRTHDGDNYRVQARARVADGQLGPVQTLSLAGQNAFNPKIAAKADGDAVVVWYASEGQDWKIQARGGSIFGLWGPVQTLSAAGQDATAPQVAIDRFGNAVIVWQRNDGTNERIQARTRFADGALGPVQTLSTVGQDAEQPQVAADRDGNAVIVWRRPDPAGDYRIQARTRAADGTLGPVQTLSEAGENALFPQVAIRRFGGKAVAVWPRFDGAKNRIQAATGP